MPGAPRVEADLDQTIEAYARLRRLAPHYDPMRIAAQLQICPTALVGEESWEYLAVEGAVKEYGAGYLAVYGYDPAPARVLEALEVIRQTRNEIEARKYRAMKGGGNG